MGIVASIQLDEHRVRSGGEMAFHDFRNVVQFLHYALVHRTAFEDDTHVGAGAVTQCLGVYVVARAYYDTEVDEALYPLVDGCA